MPVNYGSQIEEHHAVRQHAGVFDGATQHLGVQLAGGGNRVAHRRDIAVIPNQVPPEVKELIDQELDSPSN